ncbi:hypothetical protein L227DRAFT_577573 [Lentinus tigrinus ALCF2SS1-6]|uniref:Uncharacterized protein n=1 Tax=Lentinus tigrinus ALCF2SS1-6 TaxID=1328759 RepID=A0A5C2S2Z9_9APHY|nr:hypothetical protein L227DRAFT_577573 [Lentinus tigrinus ALCF2SS1-6]
MLAAGRRDTPAEGTYAVISVATELMVQHLNDPQADAEAEALDQEGGLYIVYLDKILVEPQPDDPWFSFSAILVSPKIRRSDQAQHVTYDMCVPIFPNTTHPEGREPLNTEPKFPFTNCYHWPGLEMDIRLLRNPAGFETSNVVSLPFSERQKMRNYFYDDRTKSKRMSDDACILCHLLQLGFEDRLVQDGAPIMPHTCYSRSSTAGSGSSGSQHPPARDTPLEEMLELTPLVYLVPDLSLLEQDEIDVPEKLLEERDGIAKIIQDARERNPDAPPLPLPSSYASRLASSDDDIPWETCSCADCRSLVEYLNPSPKPKPKPRREWSLFSLARYSEILFL